MNGFERFKEERIAQLKAYDKLYNKNAELKQLLNLLKEKRVDLALVETIMEDFRAKNKTINDKSILLFMDYYNHAYQEKNAKMSIVNMCELNQYEMKSIILFMKGELK